jgi:hypothetical protein
MKDYLRKWRSSQATEERNLGRSASITIAIPSPLEDLIGPILPRLDDPRPLCSNELENPERP